MKQCSMTKAALTISSTVKLLSGNEIPRLGFGVYQNRDFIIPSTLEALKAGYRHIDSAQVYRNEAEVADAVRQSGLRRQDVFITTKINSKKHGYEKAKKAIEESLDKMQFEYIDLFLIHDPYSGTERRLGAYKALLEAKAAGKIRSVGVSNYNIKHIEEIKLQGWEMPSINQIELHPFCQQKPIVEYCTAEGIVIEAYCPLLRGNMDHPAILELAEKHNRDPAQVLIRWSLQKGYVPLPKSATPSRIRSNTQVYDFELDSDDMRKLDSLDRGKEGAVSWNPIDAD
ncbi:hypothetical protein D9619_001551 [Psilocybe cf. subviscida]|uniref:NADP-dependent oxidoreductase domain-containing protein n=1 Tax=Psilocybe cf. subviscida TaxID=2480587 RepID=A0A8H5BIA5_9AGAR|nr:hypothetical protein D9619_001551 [Psilocybe cf. subviscida]